MYCRTARRRKGKDTRWVEGKGRGREGMVERVEVSERSENGVTEGGREGGRKGKRKGRWRRKEGQREVGSVGKGCLMYNTYEGHLESS